MTVKEIGFGCFQFSLSCTLGAPTPAPPSKLYGLTASHSLEPTV